MAGISILLANFLIIIVLGSSLIGLVLFVVSIILLLRKKKPQHDGKFSARKRIGIVILVISIFFQIPLGVIISGSAISSRVQEAKEKKRIESIENKVYVPKDEWKNGFDYNGKHLVPVSIFVNSDRLNGEFQSKEKIGALVIENSYEDYSFYQINNDSGYQIYFVWLECLVGVEYSRTFVDENDYDAVLDDVSSKEQTAFTDKDEYDCITLKVKSNDGVFVINLDAYTKDDEIILYLNRHRVESEVVEEYKEMFFSLIDDAQTELLQKADEM